MQRRYRDCLKLSSEFIFTQLFKRSDAHDSDLISMQKTVQQWEPGGGTGGNETWPGLYLYVDDLIRSSHETNKGDVTRGHLHATCSCHSTTKSRHFLNI